MRALLCISMVGGVEVAEWLEKSKRLSRLECLCSFHIGLLVLLLGIEYLEENSI